MKVNVGEPKKFKILVVDDDRDLVETIMESFDEKHFKIVCSFNGLEGNFKFKNEEFDVVITDIRMPKLDGIEFIKAIRMAKNIPIFVISASIEEYKFDLKPFPDVHLISKPFSPIELSKKVQAALKIIPKDSGHTELKFEAGAVVVKEDTLPQEIYFVKEGKFSIYKSVSPGEEVEIATVGAGEILGEMAVLSGDKRTASVKATTNGTLIRLPIEKVYEILDAQPNWFKIMVKSLVNRLSTTTQDLAEARSKSKKQD